MNASTIFTAIATLAFAGSAFAAEVPAANAAATGAAAAATTAAATATATAAAAATPAGAGEKMLAAAQLRDKVRAEAAQAAGSRRATEASQFDWFMK